MATLTQPRVPFRRRPVLHHRRPMESIAGDVLAFLIPAANYFVISLVGSFPAGEILVLATLPFALTKMRRIWRGYNKPLFALMAVWFLAQLVSDVYRHSPFQNMARGLAAITMFAVDFVVISALLYKNARRIILFGCGIVVYYLLYTHYYLGASSSALELSAEGKWKFGYAPLLVTSVSLICCYFYKHRRYVAVLVLFLLLGALNLYHNFRSETLFLAIAAFLILPIFRPAATLRNPNAASALYANLKRIAVMLLVVSITSTLVGKLYSHFASKGALGDAAQQKYEEQSRGKYGILLGGRPEWLVDLRAISASPFIGYGSWPENEKYAQMQQDLLRETGYSERDVDIQDPEEDVGFLIPVHSYLMQAWVWSGFLGVLFWAYALWLTLKAILTISTRPTYLAPFLFLQLIGFSWGIFFSPFGFVVRVLCAFLLTVVGTILEEGNPRAFRRSARQFVQPRPKQSVTATGILGGS